MDSILYVAGSFLFSVVCLFFVARYAFSGGKSDESSRRNSIDKKSAIMVLQKLQSKIPGIDGIRSRWRDRM